MDMKFGRGVWRTLITVARAIFPKNLCTGRCCGPIVKNYSFRIWTLNFLWGGFGLRWKRWPEQFFLKNLCRGRCWGPIVKNYIFRIWTRNNTGKFCLQSLSQLRRSKRAAWASGIARNRILPRRLNKNILYLILSTSIGKHIINFCELISGPQSLLLATVPTVRNTNRLKRFYDTVMTPDRPIMYNAGTMLKIIASICFRTPVKNE